MRFSPSLVHARFVRREKRFLVHAVLDDGAEVIAHTNNTGRMTGCLTPGGTIWLSPANDRRRKLAWTLELSETPGGVLVGVNTQRANKLVAEGIAAGLLPGLDPAAEIRAEVAYPDGKSRADFLVGGHTWVEVKNATLVENGHARFPDAPTARGRKHLLALEERVRAGERAVLVFCVQRGDARTAGPADDVDPQYGALLRRVLAAGVEVLALGVQVSPRSLDPCRILPLVLDQHNSHN